MKYGIDNKPGALPLMLYALQWWVVSLPCIVIMGAVVSRLHSTGLGEQTFYMQKLFALTGVATVVQVLWGHRLPLVVGPASTLLVGIIAARASDVSAVYTSIMAGGAFVAFMAFSGLLHRLRFFFTPRIVAVILVLIAFTLSPTILRLVLAEGDNGAPRLGFAVLAVFILVLCNKLLPGVWKSLTVLIGLAGGSLAYGLVFGFPPAMAGQLSSSSPSFFIPSLRFDAGTLLAFFFCYLALLVNELGSIESLGQMLKVSDMEKRITKGVGLQGINNILAGGLGIIGPVDFSMSAGLIGATKCASRHTLVPAGLGLLACAFAPKLILTLASIPGTVMGALLLYLMATQLASGLSMLVSENGIADFNSGLTVGLPLMIGLLIAFAPEAMLADLPGLLRPVAGNGFVVGTVSVILLEHGIFRQERQEGA